MPGGGTARRTAPLVAERTWCVGVGAWRVVRRLAIAQELTGREAHLFGTDAVDAAYLALEYWKEKEKELEDQLNTARRNITESAVLGLAAADIIAKEEDHVES